MADSDVIDILSSDSDDSTSRVYYHQLHNIKKKLVTESNHNHTDESFLTKRMKMVDAEITTMLFEENYSHSLSIDRTPRIDNIKPKRKLQVTKSLLRRKVVRPPELIDDSCDSDKLSHSSPSPQREISSIAMNSTTLLSRCTTANSGLDLLGISEEDDVSNTAQVQTMMEAQEYFRKQSLPPISDSSMTGDASIVAQSRVVSLGADELVLSDEDLSIMCGSIQKEVSETDSIDMNVIRGEKTSRQDSNDTISIMSLDDSSDTSSIEPDDGLHIVRRPTTASQTYQQITLFNADSDSSSSETVSQRLLQQDEEVLQSQRNLMESILPIQDRNIDMNILDLISDASSSDEAVSINVVHSHDTIQSMHLSHDVDTKEADSLLSDDDMYGSLIKGYVMKCTQNTQPDCATTTSPSKPFYSQPSPLLTESACDVCQHISLTQPADREYLSPSADGGKKRRMMEISTACCMPLTDIGLTPKKKQIPQNYKSKPAKPKKHKTLLISIEETLAGSDLGKSVIAALRPLYVIGPFVKCPVHGVIVMMRQINNEFVLIRDCLTIIMDGNVMIALIKEKGIDAALEHIIHIRSLLLQNDSQQMFLLLNNMQNIISEQRKKKRESIVPFTNDLLTQLYIRLRFDCNITCFPCESSQTINEWVLKTAQSIQDGPYLPVLSELGIVCRSRPVGMTSWEDEKEVPRQAACWVGLLQCIPGMSSAKAMKLYTFFPTLESLLHAYRGLSTEKDKLDFLSVINNTFDELQDKLGEDKRHKELSKRIYRSIFCEDESINI